MLDLEDLLEERAAIIEYCGNIDRIAAEKMACAQYGVEWDGN